MRAICSVLPRFGVGKLLLLLLAGCFGILSVEAAESVQVYNTCTPVMVDRPQNVLAEICINHDGQNPAMLNEVEISLKGLPQEAFRTVQLLYTGTMSAVYSRSSSWAMKDLFKRIGGSQMIYADPDYAVVQSAVVSPDVERVLLSSTQKLVRGKNYFYVSVALDAAKIPALSQPFDLTVQRIAVNGVAVKFEQNEAVPHRLGVGVRQHGDDGVYAYRIPGLVTTKAGTLLGVYDVRYHTSLDLQEDIDVGVSRSIDGGRTWEKMQIILDMGCWGGLPEAQNGVGDPSILVDERTGEIFVVAMWVHGIGNDRAWTGVGQGMSPEQTAQLMLVSSRDDGRTWSAPRNITSQVKDPSWALTLQGPGRGITMGDGTLVFPIQYIDATRTPNAGVMYSTDRGVTWQTHAYAKTNTTESQVVETQPGCLMLNMRDNRKTGRAVFTTSDMGRTWVEHPSSGALREPVCMASLLQVRADENVLQRDVLLFSNPDTTKGRNHITLKASLDGGHTWLRENQLLLDEQEGWGYSCLTMIDRETIGILYEGSTAQMLFQAVKLRDVVRDDASALTWHALPVFSVKNGQSTQGVSALYAGVVGKSLVVAGGANFPALAVAEGAAKKFYDQIGLLSDCAGQKPAWHNAGCLPEPAAYGVTYCLPEELLLVGGANAGGTLKSVYALRPQGKRVSVKRLPDLPLPLEQAAGAAMDGVLYLAGGLTAGKPSREVFSCDTKSGEWHWKALTPLPEPFVQPVMAAVNGKLYVWGGFDPQQPTVANYGYCCNLASGGWQRVDGAPDGGTWTGAAATLTAQGQVLVVGGVNRAIFTKALHLTPEQQQAYLAQAPARYCFREVLYAFDPATELWQEVGVSRHAARAGAALCSCAKGFVLIGGEIKPRVRTSSVWRIEMND